MAQHTVQHTGATGARSRSETTPLQRAALVFGAAFVLVGIAGFIPGITTDYDSMELAGHESQAQLLGVFQVSVLHNLLHLGLGALGIVAARRWTWSRTYLIGGGIAYLGLLVYGLLVDHDSDANFVPLDNADDWLHLGLGVAMVGLGVGLRPQRDGATATRW
jgi:hypothetical protein